MAPAGALVRIFYDPAPGSVVDRGHYLCTRTGRTYEIIYLRRQERGQHVGRLHLGCIVLEGPPPGAVVHPLHWYKR